MKKKLVSIILSAALLSSSLVPQASAFWGDEVMGAPGEGVNGLCTVPIIIIGGITVASVSGYIAYKLGQRNYFDRLQRKEIKLIGEPEVENIVPDGESRCDNIGSGYTRQLLEVEIPKLKFCDKFDIKYLLTLDAIALPLRLVLKRDDAGLPPEAKTIEGQMQGVCVMIRRLRSISPHERVVTFKYLVDLITEMDTLFRQSTAVINGVLHKKSQ